MTESVTPDLPVIDDVDCCIVGGTTAAVACALAARAAGATVLVAAPRPYLGDDLAAHQRFWHTADDQPTTDLARRIFTDRAHPPTPMQVKRSCEQALIAAGIPFVLDLQPVAVLRDARGRLAGVAVGDKAGCQAIRAAQVVDATEHGLVATMAGCQGDAATAAVITARRLLIGGDGPHGRDIACEALPTPVVVPDEPPRALPAWEASLQCPCRDRGPVGLGAVEQTARLALFARDQQQSPDAIALPTAWSEPEATTGDSALAPGLWRLPCDQGAVAAALRPCARMAAGAELGTRLAAVDERPGPVVGVEHAAAEPVTDGELRYLTTGLRPFADPVATVPGLGDRVPLLDEVDVVVVGGGTAGAPAGIAAARQGARTLVLEQRGGLGGVGTLGMIGRYYHGNRVGFTAEIDAALAGGMPADSNGWNIEWRMDYYLRQLDAAGGRAWFGTTVYGALVADGVLRGVLVAGPYGCGLVRARMVLDCSGSADVVAAAGGACIDAGREEIAVQGTGMSIRAPGDHYNNSDHTFSDDTDLVDTTRAFVSSRVKFSQRYDLATLVDSRERRQIVGDLTLSPLDFLRERTFADSVCLARSNFDSHGFTIHPLFQVLPPDKASIDAYVPLRCLLPRGLENIAATGLAVSCHRDALPVIRMQPDVQNQGYALGAAAAMAVAAGTTLRRVDVAAVQQHLVAMDILDAAVCEQRDSPPPDDAILERAAAGELENYHDVALCFAEAERMRPLLQRAWAASAPGARRLRLAQILGLLGDATGADDLLAAVSGRAWDAGWNYTGMGQFGRSMSPLDDLVVALGRSGAARAIDVVVDKVNALGADPDFSHCRAVALAAADLAAHDTQHRLAPALATVLARPGMTGHDQRDLAAAQADLDDDPCHCATRNRSLRELVLARGCYRAGDVDGLAAAILRRYRDDVRGHYARHARAVLDG